jgi:acetyl-CoA carboxylase carboxyl transferase subunit beta
MEDKKMGKWFFSKKPIPKQQNWEKCPECNEIIYTENLQKNLNVCPRCSHHFKFSSEGWLDYLLNKRSFQEFATELETTDPLKFSDGKESYLNKLDRIKKKTGLKSAIRVGTGKIGKHHVGIGVMDFAFLGGSMGIVVGEKITLLFEKATEKKLPVIMISTSGGARMHEGIFSLMQMAKTSAAIKRHSEKGLLFISILTNPTTGGVSASFAALGDILIGEPKALIGFAGPRVIEQTIRQKLPAGFQSAEFLLEKGMIDMIVPRLELKDKLQEMLKFFSK